MTRWERLLRWWRRLWMKPYLTHVGMTIATDFYHDKVTGEYFEKDRRIA